MRSESPTIARWSRLLEGVRASPLDFYATIEDGVREREVPSVVLSRVDWSEGGVFSAKREYLRITHGRYVMDICGAPFGTGFFVSSWLTTVRTSIGFVAIGAFLLVAFVLLFLLVGSFGFWGAVAFAGGSPLLLWYFAYTMNANHPGWDDPLLALPLLGGVYQRLFRPVTYYQLDTAIMFQSAVHNAVLAAVDQLTKPQGVRALPESARAATYQAF